MKQFDTDVLIWYMRGNEKARKLIEDQNGFAISAVTYMEVVQGMRNKEELKVLRRAIHELGIKILYITEDITTKAMFYVEQHYLSHAVQLADALVGSTAVSNGLTLVTANDKHYKSIKEIELQIFRP